jgi:hypothetical protein
VNPGPAVGALTPASRSPGSEVDLRDLRVGDVLAEGGEGRVHLLPRQPHLVLKLYRRPASRDHLADLVAWPSSLPPAAEAVVRAHSSWPVSLVRGSDGEAAGLLVPRAPRRFAVRHRDGHSRLASLSYLTADPDHRAAAYGLRLPEPAGPERVGLVLSLARLLCAFGAGVPSAGHGDLSTKNVLWSFQRAPEVYVIDCDSAELFGEDGRPVRCGVRRRAMTPNWDDPAVPAGSNPDLRSDRYSLALVFLRVVGAANFPVQARQRAGGPLEVRFGVPAGPGAAVLADPGCPLWSLCSRALSLSGPRPAPAEWLGPLEELLATMGAPPPPDLGFDPMPAGTVARSEPPVGGRVGGGPVDAGSEEPPVVVRPEPAGRRERSWSRVAPAPRFGSQPAGRPTAAFGYRFATFSSPRSSLPNPASAQPRPVAPAWVRPSAVAAAPPATSSVGASGPPGPGRSPVAAGARGGGPAPGGSRGGSLVAPPGGAPGSRPPSPWLSAGAGAPIWPEVRAELVRFARWWLALHRAAGAVLLRRRQPRRLRAVAACLVVDFVLAVLGGAALALVISPIVQG